MEALNIAVACTVSLILVISLFTSWLRQHWITGPLLALLLGVVIGPAGLGWLDLAEHEGKKILGQVARFSLAIVLVSVGLQLPHRYIFRYWRSITVLTFGGMALMWLTSTLLLKWILALELLPALLIGAVITPLDPILASGITTGKIAEHNLPERTRHLLSFESAATHGFGYLLVLLPVLLFTKSTDVAWSDWLTQVLLWDGLAAMVVGGVIGYFVGSLHKWSTKKGFTEKGLLLVVFVALALSVMAVVKLMGSDSLLAVAVAGFTYALVRVNEKKGEELENEENYYERTFKQLLQVPVYVLLGLLIPWDKWMELGWAGLGLITAVFFLRRIPALLLMKPLIPQIPRWDEALFVGWFGPIGVGALHFALLAEEHTHFEPVWVVGSLLIIASTVVHDLTLTPLTKWFGRRLSGDQENSS